LARRQTLRRLATTLVVAGLSLFAVAAWELLDRERHQELEQQQLQQALEARSPRQRSRASATSGAVAAGARARAARGEAWGRLDIARIGLSVALDEGVDATTLRHAVGHLPGAAFPGEPGNVVLAGHRDGLFRPLQDVREGDRLRQTTTDGSFDYRVTSVAVVAPERTDVTDPAPGRQQVTLVTCYPFYFVGPAPQRYVVKAERLADAASPATADAAAAVR